MSDILTRRDLDALLAERCLDPACRHGDAAPQLGLMPACHPRGRLDVSYGPDGLLRLVCQECSQPVATIAVAATLA
jgi:hypothetical protein